MIELLRRLIPKPFRDHAPCPGCRVSVEFTGAPPLNASEILVDELAGGRRSVPLHWLEERIADALYHAELRHSAGVNDIGLWGPAMFHKESAHVLADMRPEFGNLREDGKPT